MARKPRTWQAAMLAKRGEWAPKKDALVIWHSFPSMKAAYRFYNLLMVYAFQSGKAVFIEKCDHPGCPDWEVGREI